MSIGREVYAWLSNDAIEVVQSARDLARVLRQRHFRGPHVLFGAFQAGLFDQALRQADIERDAMAHWLEELSRNATAAWAGGRADPVLESSMLAGIRAASEARGHKLSATELVAKILEGHCGMREGELTSMPLDSPTLLTALRQNGDDGVIARGRSEIKPRPSAIVSATDASGVLAQYGLDLMTVAPDIAPALYETQLEAVERIAGVLGRLMRPSVLLVGESGVGKTAVVDGLARWIHDGRGPAWLNGVRIVSVSCSRVVSGGRYPGQLEERIQGLIDIARGRPDVLLFFDELHVLGDAAMTGAGSLFGLFQEAISRNELRILAATPSRGFETTLQKHEALVRRFEVVRLKEPSGEQLKTIVKTHVPKLRAHYGVELDENAIDVLLSSCERFLPGRRFPAKALETLDAAFQRARTSSGRLDAVARRVEATDIQEVISEESGVPVATLTEMDQAKLRGLREYLDAKIYEQELATATMSRAIQSIRLGLKNENRTGGAFLFVGPPGTGKTELAKVLAEYLMGSVSALVRFNMSEFQTPESYQRLVGPPPGYVGFEAGGELTNRLRENPYSVVLFDEIEKGSSRVFDVFLQVLSDGHLTDNHGQLVDCKNSIFIMTSNALAEVQGCDDIEIRRRLLQFRDPQSTSGLGPTFRREFIDRLELVPFMALSSGTLHRIARREVEQVLKQVSRGRILNCEIEVDETTMGWLVEQIDAKVTGARSVQRLVESTVSRAIGDGYLRGILAEGGKYLVTLPPGGSLEIISRT